MDGAGARMRFETLSVEGVKRIYKRIRREKISIHTWTWKLCTRGVEGKVW